MDEKINAFSFKTTGLEENRDDDEKSKPNDSRPKKTKKKRRYAFIEDLEEYKKQCKVPSNTSFESNEDFGQPIPDLYPELCDTVEDNVDRSPSTEEEKTLHAESMAESQPIGVKKKRKSGGNIKSVIKDEENEDVKQRIGSWVQCCRPDCGKWRCLNITVDAHDVADKWVCAMNPDINFNRCDSIQEDFDSQDSEYDVIYTSFPEGSIVWAKVAGYPWWPGMMEDDPDYGYYCEADKDNSRIPTSYHIVFFDKEVSRAWISQHNVRPFRANDVPEEQGSVVFRGKNYKKKLDQATEQAKEALVLPPEERLKVYGFAQRYGGKIRGPRKVKTPKEKKTKAIVAEKKESIVEENLLEDSPNSLDIFMELSDEFQASDNNDNYSDEINTPTLKKATPPIENKAKGPSKPKPKEYFAVKSNRGGSKAPKRDEKAKTTPSKSPKGSDEKKSKRGRKPKKSLDENVKQEVASFQSPISSSTATVSVSSPVTTEMGGNSTDEPNSETQETAKQNKIKETNSLEKKPRLVPSLKKAKHKIPKVSFVTQTDCESLPNDKRESLDDQCEVDINTNKEKKQHLVSSSKKPKHKVPKASFVTQAEGTYLKNHEGDSVLDEKHEAKQTKSPKKPRLIKPKQKQKGNDTISSSSENNARNLHMETQEESEAGAEAFDDQQKEKMVKEQVITNKKIEEQLIKEETCEEQMIKKQPIKEHIISEKAKKQTTKEPKAKSQMIRAPNEVSTQISVDKEKMNKMGCKSIKNASVQQEDSSSKTTTTPNQPQQPKTVHVPTPMPKLIKASFRPPSKTDSSENKAHKKMPKLSKVQFVQPSRVDGNDSAKNDSDMTQRSNSMAISDLSQEKPQTKSSKELEGSAIACNDPCLADEVDVELEKLDKDIENMKKTFESNDSELEKLRCSEESPEF